MGLDHHALVADLDTFAVAIVDALADAVSAHAEDAMQLAEAGHHASACRAVQVNGIVDAPAECDCGWGAALEAHVALLAEGPKASGLPMTVEPRAVDPGYVLCEHGYLRRGWCWDCLREPAAEEETAA